EITFTQLAVANAIEPALLRLSIRAATLQWLCHTVDAAELIVTELLPLPHESDFRFLTSDF
ncbi:MAG TPA: hypothetical protein VH229_05865, partial [Candidatus Udaeobacter sp.]|nr:hypothetical protein [Candidatus Udaeobacter sp.]